ncbi:MAG: glycosyltransferase family 4 protein [Actinomycetota bacterium]
MKIALVCPYDLGRHGGVQDQVIRLSSWLEDLGHDTVIVGPGDEGPPGAILVGSVKVIKANAAATPIALSPKVSSRLKAAVEDVDVIHIHEPLMPTVSMAATRISDKPTVGTFHADPPGWARKGYSALSPLVRRVLGNLDVVTTVSPVSRSAIEPFVQARLIPNGIDTASYAPGTKTMGRVAFVGRDDARKGLDVLIEAWRWIHDSEPAATLHIMGARRDDPPEGVTYLGRVDEGTKAAELATSEIFVAPNLGGESFGIVVAEGMAAGAAVVASGIPAFLHVLGGAGTIVAPGDSSGLAQAVITLLRDPAMRADLGAKAIDRVQRFDGQHVAQEYAAAYADALDKHRV